MPVVRGRRLPCRLYPAARRSHIGPGVVQSILPCYFPCPIITFYSMAKPMHGQQVDTAIPRIKGTKTNAKYLKIKNWLPRQHNPQPAQQPIRRSFPNDFDLVWTSSP